MATEISVWLFDRGVAVQLAADLPTLAAIRTLPDVAARTSPGELADAAKQELAARGDGASAVTLVLPSSWCYVHRFQLPQRRPSHEVLSYALEDYLPADAEELTCDFIRTAAGNHIGIAVETARVRPLLEALAGRDVHVEHIFVDVFQAARLAGVGESFLWCDTEHVGLLRRDERGIQDVRVVRLAPGLADDEWGERVAAHLQLASHPSIGVVGIVAPARLASLGCEAPGVPSPQRPADRGPKLACPCPDLARGELAGRHQRTAVVSMWRGAAAAMLVALLALAAGLQVHRARIADQIEAVEAWERSVYRQLFPDEPVPAGIALRLASERRRLEGLTGTTSPAAAPTLDALMTLRQIVAAMPASVPLDVQEIEVENGDVTLRGSTRDHRQAEQLAATFSHLDGFSCEAPRTQRLPSGGVQFFLRVRRTASSSSSTAQPGAPMANAIEDSNLKVPP